MTKSRYILDYALTRLVEDSFGNSAGKSNLGQACIEISREEMAGLIKHLIENDFTECHKTKVKVSNG